MAAWFSRAESNPGSYWEVTFIHATTVQDICPNQDMVLEENPAESAAFNYSDDNLTYSLKTWSWLQNTQLYK